MINSYIYNIPIGKIKISDNGKSIIEIREKYELNFYINVL